MKVLHYAFSFVAKTAMTMASSLGRSVILTIGKAAECLKVTLRTIYQLACRAKIPTFKVGKFRWFSRSKIDNKQHSSFVESGERA